MSLWDIHVNKCHLFSPLPFPRPEQALWVRLNDHGKSNPPLVSAAAILNTNAINHTCQEQKGYNKSGTKTQQCYSFLVRSGGKTMLVSADFLLKRCRIFGRELCLTMWYNVISTILVSHEIFPSMIKNAPRRVKGIPKRDTLIQTHMSSISYSVHFPPPLLLFWQTPTSQTSPLWYHTCCLIAPLLDEPKLATVTLYSPNDAVQVVVLILILKVLESCLMRKNVQTTFWRSMNWWIFFKCKRNRDWLDM